jgi:hypothetical protein
MGRDIEIKESDIIEATQKGMDEFIKVFTSKYKDIIKGDSNTIDMTLLNGEQHTLLAYDILHDELLEGGFCQLIQNGYGSYIFDNPFAKAMRLWGLQEFSKLIYKAKKIYDKNKVDLSRERTDDEFMAMYESYEQFDDLEDTFIENEEEITGQIAHFVDEHIEDFAKIVK